MTQITIPIDITLIADRYPVLDRLHSTEPDR
jgi:hypothetical protein